MAVIIKELVIRVEVTKEKVDNTKTMPENLLLNTTTQQQLALTRAISSLLKDQETR
ncbi:hypothetical protein [Cardinium endosymbiont of Oedothorax gibbosus]|uniref:hypothetical protein n=1 Tax=Cardinium endosymbiont of Oedothorax gibbosus TaxID=931101 RepID=UPI002023E14B|nr:hypothetical protein [Cardinium endosymbiont of Oedothorax gibbosus]CAH2559989.1 Putative Afp-like phage protein [Cardinium endosymbiont of Oedothorax gibbosus]